MTAFKKPAMRALAIILCLFVFTTPAEAVEFAGMPLAPDATVSANYPLNAQEKSCASAGGNQPPANAVVTIAVPPNFRPDKTWPVLIVLSTSDEKIQNRDDLKNIYRKFALAEGWVALAGDGPAPAAHDTAGWRVGMTCALARVAVSALSVAESPETGGSAAKICSGVRPTGAVGEAVTDRGRAT